LAPGSCSPRSAPTGDWSEATRVLAAVLAAQPDYAADRARHLAQFPEERSHFEGLFDHRLCVAGETAGSTGDFRRPTGKGEWDSSTLREQWDDSERRVPLPAEVLPDHLRWNWPLAVCPNGVLRLGNPEVDGATARVFIENKCTGWCGSGGEVLL